MSKGLFFLGVLHLTVLTCQGQTMAFGGGTLHVQPGTQMRIVGPVDWQLAADAEVINDGTIEMGSQATVNETDGAPITGAGSELALWPFVGALNAAEPGGLGLTITSTYAGGDLLVERGHLPSFAPNGSMSIARWYHITTPAPANDDLSVVMHYDLTELNGIAPSALGIFGASALSGTWTPLITTGDELAQTLEANDPSPWAFLSAFDSNAVMALGGALPQDAIRIWPTLVVDAVYIAMPASRAMDRVTIHDAVGRVVLDRSNAWASGIVQLDLSALTKGAYVLSVNRNEAVRTLIKQ